MAALQALQNSVHGSECEPSNPPAGGIKAWPPLPLFKRTHTVNNEASASQSLSETHRTAGWESFEKETGRNIDPVWGGHTLLERELEREIERS